MTPSEQRLKDQIDLLVKKIEALEKWKTQKMIQQISLPLDESSKNIINNI